LKININGMPITRYKTNTIDCTNTNRFLFLNFGFSRLGRNTKQYWIDEEIKKMILINFINSISEVVFSATLIFVERTMGTPTGIVKY
jgi:hypothetical protein